MTHACHVPDCDTTTPRRMLMCRPHWRIVPFRLQREVNRHFVGQQVDPRSQLQPSKEWRISTHLALASVFVAQGKTRNWKYMPRK